MAEKITFDNEGTFQALYAAERWCKENGYSYGSMCNPEPIGIKKGDCYIAKWQNLNAAERKQVDGKITSSNFREGPVTIEIY